MSKEKKEIEAIELLETRTIQGKQTQKGAVLVVGDDISEANARFLEARKEAKFVKSPKKEKAPEPAKSA